MTKTEGEGEGTPVDTEDEVKEVPKPTIVLMPPVSPNKTDGQKRMELVFNIARYFGVTPTQARGMLDAMEAGLFCANLDTKDGT